MQSMHVCRLIGYQAVSKNKSNTLTAGAGEEKGQQKKRSRTNLECDAPPAFSGSRTSQGSRRLYPLQVSAHVHVYEMLR